MEYQYYKITFPQPFYKNSGDKQICGMDYYGYMDICLGSNYYYALFRGEECFNENKQDIQNVIRVFDKEGAPVQQLIFDKSIDPSSFYVDETSKKVYFTVPDSENQIFVYSYSTDL